MGESRPLSERVRVVLPTALGGVDTADLVGGIWDIAAGRASPSEAGGSDATLCARGR